MEYINLLQLKNFELYKIATQQFALVGFYTKFAAEARIYSKEASLYGKNKNPLRFVENEAEVFDRIFMVIEKEERKYVSLDSKTKTNKTETVYTCLHISTGLYFCLSSETTFTIDSV